VGAHQSGVKGSPQDRSPHRKYLTKAKSTKIFDHPLYLLRRSINHSIIKTLLYRLLFIPFAKKIKFIVIVKLRKRIVINYNNLTTKDPAKIS
jgi:hypothetical protein